MTWIKICGTTNLDDALMSVDAGADALGFVFWEKSPRYIAPRDVAKIVARLPVQVEKVGVFVEQPFSVVRQVVEEAGLTAAQLHFASLGDNKWADANFKKYFVAQVAEPSDTFGVHKSAMWIDAVFMDSGTRDQPGGTGETFDWRKASSTSNAIRDCGYKLVVAGGLKASNVAEAIRILDPWGVDVVTGVEATPGKKDPEKVRAFIKAVSKAS